LDSSYICVDLHAAETDTECLAQIKSSTYFGYRLLSMSMKWNFIRELTEARWTILDFVRVGGMLICKVGGDIVV
jgi:hypothetical protein